MTMPSSLSGGAGIRSNFGAAGGNQARSNIAGYRQAQIPSMSPEQINLFKYILGNVPQQGLAQGLGLTGGIAGGDQGAFAQMEAPAYTALQKAGSQLGSQFAGLGRGALGTSGFQNALAGQAGELAETLQSKRMGLQRQAIQDLLGLSEGLLGQRPYENVLVQKQKPWWQQFLLGTAQKSEDLMKEAVKYGMSFL